MYRDLPHPIKGSWGNYYKETISIYIRFIYSFVERISLNNFFNKITQDKIECHYMYT